MTKVLNTILERATAERVKILAALAALPAKRAAEARQALGDAEVRILLASIALGKAPIAKAIGDGIEELGGLIHLAGTRESA